LGLTIEPQREVSSEAAPLPGRAARRRPLELAVGPTLLYLAPALALLGVVYGYAVVELVRLSISRVGLGTTPSQYVGAENFNTFLDDPAFHQSLQNNLKLFVGIPVIVIFAVVLAYSFNDEYPGWRGVRVLVFLPYVLAITVVGLVFGRVFTLDGILNESLRTVGLGALSHDWLGTEGLALWAILTVIVWKEAGLGVLLMHAAILDTPKEQIDAARMDGAGWWRRLRHVVVPHISRQIELYVVVLVITLLSWVFAYVFVMTRGGPGTSTFVTELYVYLQSFRYGAIGVGAAVSLALLVVCIVGLSVAVAARRLARR
jgi:ABC-type sugar transport system permease subunit